MLFGKNGKPSAEKLAAAAAEVYGDANKNKDEKSAEEPSKDSSVSDAELKDSATEIELSESQEPDAADEKETVEYGT